MKLNNLFYALSAFIIFATIILIIKWFGGKLPVNNALWGVYTRSDLALSLAAAIVVTISHIRKWKLRG